MSFNAFILSCFSVDSVAIMFFFRLKDCLYRFVYAGTQCCNRCCQRSGDGLGLSGKLGELFDQHTANDNGIGNFSHLPRGFGIPDTEPYAYG